MPENGVTAPTKDMQGIEVYVRESIPLDLSDRALADIQRISTNALLIDSELSGALFGIGDKGKAPSITGNVDELKKGGLVSVIPNGFLMLHNDLQSLSSPKGEKEESGGSGGKLSFLSDFVKGFAGAAGVAAGAAAALALFNGGEGTSESLRGVVEELDADISADDYKDDPEVAAVKREAVLGYLKMYYTSQTASLAGEAIGNTLSSAVTSFVTNIAGDLFNAILGREDNPSATSLEYIATTLDSSMTMEELGLAEGGEYRETVVAEKRKATAAYLATYYASQIIDSTAGDLVGTISDVAAELVGGTLRKIVEKIKGKEENASSLESFVSTLDASMTMEELGLAEGGEHRELVLKEKRIATATYLATYYASQVTNLVANEAAGTFSDFASEIVGGTIRKIYDKLKGKEENSTSLGSFVSTLDSSMTMDELGLSEGGEHRELVLKEKRNATTAYLAAYYKGQTGNLKGTSLASTISDFAIDLVSNTLERIFGKRKDKEEDVNSLGSFVSSLDSSMTMEDLGIAPGGAYREEVAEEKRKATKAYLTAYYSSQAPDSSMLASDERVLTLTRNTLASLFNLDATEDANSLKSFVVELDKSLTMEDLGLAAGGAYRDEVVEKKRETVAAYVDSYYSSQLATVTADSSSALVDAVDTVKKTLQGLFSGSEDTSTLTDLVTQLDASISLEELGFNEGGANRSRVLGVQADAVTEYLKAYYSAQVTSLTKDLDSNIAGSLATSTVKSFFSGLFGKKSETSDPFLESLRTITQNLGAEIDVAKFSYENNIAVRDAVDSSVAEYLTEFLSKEKDALIDSIDDTALRVAARDALAKVSLDLSPLASLSLPKYNIATEETSENEATSAATTYDDRNLLKKLDDVINNLEALLGAFQERPGNTTIISAGGNSYSIDEEFKIQ